MKLKNASLLGVLVFALAAAGCNGARNDAVNLGETSDHRGFITRTLPNGRKYVVFLPAHYTPSRKWPAIMFLHGVGEAGSSMEGPLRVGLAPFACDRRAHFEFIVVIPQSTGGWDADSNNARDAIAALRQAKHDFAIDPDRVYLTGLSTGGYGTFAIGAKYHEEFAALAPMCPSGADAGDGQQLGRMHVWAFENAVDPFVAPASMAITLGSIQKNGGTLKHTVYPAVGHDCWDTAYKDGEVFQWMLMHSRSGGLATNTTAGTAAPLAGTAMSNPAFEPAPAARPVMRAAPVAKASPMVPARSEYVAPVQSRRASMPETPY